LCLERLAGGAQCAVETGTLIDIPLVRPYSPRFLSFGIQVVLRPVFFATVVMNQINPVIMIGRTMNLGNAPDPILLRTMTAMIKNPMNDPKLGDVLP
jgi:hypothetical protein